jgi:hypothetical protein
VENKATIMTTNPRRRGNADLTPEVAIVRLDVGVIT